MHPPFRITFAADEARCACAIPRIWALLRLAAVCLVWSQPELSLAASSTAPEIAVIYFPSYHQDDHYDSWFGEGWNEWELLSRAPARFAGHRIFESEWGRFDEADPTWMARQIALAADHQVDVFIFDWYWYSGVRILQRPLEQGFLRATNQSRLKFALMWANHDWRNYFPAPQAGESPMLLPSRTSGRDFGRLMDYCRHAYFHSTNYWRIAGACYFGIFESEKFVQQLGGADATRQILGRARQQLRAAGLGGIHFCAFHWMPEAVPQLQKAGFDSVTTYNITASSKASIPDQPLDHYANLVEAHAATWKRMDSGLLPYLPVVTVGWDCTPRWEKSAPFPPKHSAYPYGSVVVSNTPAGFGRLCRLAHQHATEARLRSPAIVVNAWNEWTEGSVLLPERVHGTNFLKALAEAVP